MAGKDVCGTEEGREGTVAQIVVVERDEALWPKTAAESVRIRSIDRDLARKSVESFDFAAIHVGVFGTDGKIESIFLKRGERLRSEDSGFEYGGQSAIDQKNVSCFIPYPELLLIDCLEICHSSLDRQRTSNKELYHRSIYQAVPLGSLSTYTGSKSLSIRLTLTR